VHSVNLGAPVAGELIIVVTSCDGAPTFVVPDETASGKGWQRSPLVRDSGGVSVSSVVHAKIAAGSDVLTLLTEGAEQCSHFAIRISGHGSAVALASSNGNSANADPPNVAITGAAQDVLWLAASCQDAQVVASAAPAGYGNLNTKTATNSAGASVSIADKTANATSDNPGTFTTANEQWVAWAIAVPSVAITSAARSTQIAAESASHIDAALIATQLAAEIVSSNVLTMRASQLCAEMLSANVLTMQASQLCAEVVSRDDTGSGGPAMLFIAT
jgi:hypothetical protein